MPRFPQSGRTSRRTHRAWPAGLLVAALGLGASSARADGTLSPVVMDLFQKGRAADTAGDFVAACASFTEAIRIDGQRRYGLVESLGHCNEGQGKTATAWSLYKEAAFIARRENRAQDEANASSAASLLEPKLSKLQINAAETPGLIIRSDGQEMGKGVLGAAHAVDPGKHVIEATAPGYSVWTTTVTVGPDGDTQKVQIPLLNKEADKPRPASTRRTAGFVIGGVGLAGTVVGGVFGALASSQASSAKSDPTLCPNQKCTAAGRKEIDAASSKATLSSIGMIAGPTLLVAGAVLVLTSGSSPSRESPTPAGTHARGWAQPTARLLPTFQPNGGGLALVGGF